MLNQKKKNSKVQNSTTNPPSIYRRLSDKEINDTRERYADDGLFRAIDSIGTKLENSTPMFGIRTEEAYVYTLNLLRKIARQDYDAEYKVHELRDAECDECRRLTRYPWCIGCRFEYDPWDDELRRLAEDLWDAEYAGCRRLTRNLKEDESRRVVGIVFEFAILALYSLRDRFYAKELMYPFIDIIYDKKVFDGRDELYELFLTVAVPEGWMDEFLVRVKDDPSTPSATSATSAADGTSAGDDEPSLARTNTVFSPRLFDSEEKLARVREAILQSFVAAGESADKSAGTGTSAASDGKFDPSVQADWYSVLRAVVEAGVTPRAARISGRGFVRQMIAWLPELFLRKEGETKEETVSRYARSLSKERKKWVRGTERKEVPIKDLIAFARGQKYGNAKALRLFTAAGALKRRLEELKDDLRKEAGA